MNKVKNRGWVKNVAIIFLTVMLILTFFSNTIMNRSLPEVATQAVTSDSITAKIRGTGTVTANGSYEVMADSTRKVKTVMIKEGQEVNTGDTLFILEAGASEELSAARDTLRAAQKAYQEALINNADADYAKENRDIKLAREGLAEAQAKLEKLTVTEAELTQARQNAEYYKSYAEEMKKAYEKAQKDLEDFGGKNSVSEEDKVKALQTINDKRQEISLEEAATEGDYLIYGSRYFFVEIEARKRARQYSLSYSETMPYVIELIKKGEIKVSGDGNDFSAWVKKLQDAFTLDPNGNMYYLDSEITSDCYEKLDKKPSGLYSEEFYIRHMPSGKIYSLPTASFPAYTAEDFETAYTTLTTHESNLEKLNEELARLQSDYQRMLAGDNTTAYNAYSEAVKAAEEKSKAADELKTKADEAMAKLEEQQKSYEDQQTTVKGLEKELENKLFDFAQQQKNDNKASQLAALNLQELAYNVSEAQKKLDALSGTDESANEIKASVSGIVRTVSITAGNTTTPNTSMATIEVPDMGYGLSFSVTNEQARRVHKGDVATVSNYYWGSTIEATLTAIKTDPKNPQTSKLLEFELSGDVTAGSSLTLSVGEKSAAYDYVVPNSAIRNDANGDFVLIITAKSSPLGNRYTATRVDVTVIASDDTSSAISGGIQSGDFVITTSTAPIKNGDRVRMADAA